MEQGLEEWDDLSCFIVLDGEVDLAFSLVDGNVIF